MSESALSIRNLEKAYTRGTPVLRDVSLEIGATGIGGQC